MTDHESSGLGAWELANYYLQPILHLLEEPGVSEISANRFDEIFVTRRGIKTKSDVSFPTEDAITLAIRQAARALGQECDEVSAPILDARLHDGSRFAASLYPVSTRGSSFSVRVFPKKPITVDDLVAYKSLTSDMLELIRVATLLRSNTIVSGGTGSGKTTMLNAISAFVPSEDRVLICEDTHEIQANVPDQVILEAPQKRKVDDQAQVITLTSLIKHCLRRTPTRIFVGEIRDDEAATAFYQAINTGHSGCVTTVHANNCESALIRIQTLIAGAGAGLSYDIVKDQVRADLHLLIHCEDTPNHGKRVVELAEVHGGEIHLLWQWHYGKGHHECMSEALAGSRILKRASLYSIETTLCKTTE